MDTLEIKVLEDAIVDAGTSFFTCGNAATLEANIISDASGIWTLDSGPNSPNILSPTNPSTQLTGLVQGVYRFAWTITSQNVCNTGEFDFVTVEVTAGPEVDIDVDCNTQGGQSEFSYTISVSGSGFTGSFNIDGFDSHSSLAYNQVHGPFGPFVFDELSYELIIVHSESDCSDIVELITPNCAAFDYGDLPDNGPGTGTADYETLAEHNGPAHLIVDNLRFATLLDKESNGQPSNDALADGSDEDAFLFIRSLEAIKGASYTFPLSIINTTGSIAYADVWVDWNADGDFNDLDELVFDLEDDANGNLPTNILTLDIPDHAAENQVIGLRARLSHEPNMTPLGIIQSGEVEDYLFTVIATDDICLPLIIQVGGN